MDNLWGFPVFPTPIASETFGQHFPTPKVCRSRCLPPAIFPPSNNLVQRTAPVSSARNWDGSGRNFRVVMRVVTAWTFEDNTYIYNHLHRLHRTYLFALW